MLEKYLIENCAPTLASIKTANLFTMDAPDTVALEQSLRSWNERFAPKGVRMMLLKNSGGRALIYVCRMGRLQRDLEKPGVAAFLQAYGYRSTDAEAALALLQCRLQASPDFPHEIGIFLGYPLGDVVGFIRNAGQNAKCVGCWKVYCNECEAVKTFARYKKCREIYIRLWKEGRDVSRLTVAA